MAKFNQDLQQFGSAKPANTGGSQHCAQCEAMLADALDGMLSAEEQARFDAHMAGCASCGQMLADAERGAAWLEMLRTPRPEPPAALLGRILAQTGGQATAPESNILSILPSAATSVITAPMEDRVLSTQTARVLPFRRRIASGFHLKSIGHALLQPRLAMTAAMAFFSIGLTLNLTGVKLNELHASDLKPSNVKRNFYQANAYVVRYVDNLRAVYELESRVRDLQHGSDENNTATPEPAAPKPAESNPPATKDGQPNQKQARPRSGSGTSRRQGPSDPLSIAPFQLAGSPVSPPRSYVSVASFSGSDRLDGTGSTLQEGELV